MYPLESDNLYKFEGEANISDPGGERNLDSVMAIIRKMSTGCGVDRDRY
jgi:hypothetical protein